MGEVVRLFQCLARRQLMSEFEEVFAVEGKGFQECVHGRRGSSRQVLLMDQETLEEFGIAPGRARENVTTRGIVPGSLALGQRLHVGEALLQVTSFCTPCHRMDEIREGLQEAIRGRRGVLCRVIQAGRIRRGDPVEVEEMPRASQQNSSDSVSGAC
jgi:MOSC domain-containing protein YiiM